MGKRAAWVVLGSALAVSGVACNTFDEPGVEGSSKLVIPVDARPVVQALSAPPPISGGTLAISRDGERAIAADPDRDRISIVELGSARVTHVALEAGDEPGRVVVDGSGRAFVALRRAGAVAVLDLDAGAIVARVPTCSAPRGLALDEARSLLHVACAEGRLLSLESERLSVARELHIDGDLRDVVLSAGGLRVSTFKSSELIDVDVEGRVAARVAPRRFQLDVLETEAGQHFGIAEVRQRPMVPRLAWRAVGGQDGSVLMLHQGAADEEIDIERRPGTQNTSASAYGGEGGRDCQGVVVNGVSRFFPDGRSRTIALASGVLDVDMALSPTGTELAIVEAGTADPAAPRPTIVTDPEAGDVAVTAAATPPFSFVSGVSDSEFPAESRLFRFPLGEHGAGPELRRLPDDAEDTASVACFPAFEMVETPGQATAVAYTSSGDIVVQSREPALLTILGNQSRVIQLGGASVRDTGHEVFHRDSGGGIACASCHAEGAEDGHTWKFSGQGLRRTQALHVGLAGTAPFHWAGDEPTLEVLMKDVFVGRMGGVHQSEPRVSALSRFLFALKPPAAALAADDPAALRGKELFESAAVGCAGCHSGASLSDNRSYDVGTSGGVRLQVPSLRGVAYRAPFLHTGCAKTLRERFDPACGGPRHGEVAHLGPDEIDDLVAYLRTL